MNIKKAIHKIAVPIMKPHGYELVADQGGYYRFEKNSQAVIIDYHKMSFMPPYIELNCWIKDCPSPSMRRAFIEKKINGVHYYSDQEDLDKAIANMANDAVQRVMPYLEKFKNNWYRPDLTDYTALSKDPNAIACAFQDRFQLHHRDINELPMCLDCLLSQIRPKDPAERAKAAQNHFEDIIGMAAVIGETLLEHWKNPNLRWGWVEIPEFKDGDVVVLEAQHKFLICDDQFFKFNPLYETIGLWNYGPEILDYSMQKSFEYWKGEGIKQPEEGNGGDG